MAFINFYQPRKIHESCQGTLETESSFSAPVDEIHDLQLLLHFFKEEILYH